MSSLRPCLSKYFYWLVFSGTLFIISEILRMSYQFQFYRVRLLDVLATYALLGSVGIVVASLASVLLAAFEIFADRNHRALSYIPNGILFVALMTVWLNILRLTLAANGVKLTMLPPMPQILVLSFLAALVFIAFRADISAWMGVATGRIRGIALVSMAVFVGLTVYLLVEPLDHGRAAPVTAVDTGARRPDVVIVILDALTTRDMSLYGYHLPTTPNLERLARTWTIYENAHSSGTGTLAIMPTLLTGRYPYMDQWPSYGDKARSSEGWMNLPEIMRALGYETTYIAGQGYPPGQYHFHTGFDRVIAGNTRFPGRDFLSRTLWAPLGAKFMLGEYIPRLQEVSTDASASSSSSSYSMGSTSEPMYAVAEQLFGQTTSSDAGKPSFTYIHMNRPHAPYHGDEFLGTFLPVEDGLIDAASQKRLNGKYSPDQQPEVDKLRLRYDENILKADAEMGELIGALQRSGAYDRSLIIATADHGTTFGPGYQGYGTPLLSASEHSVPLLVKYPGQTQGKRVSALVSNVDILPTILEAVGADYPAGWVDGQSLLHAEQNTGRIVYVRVPGERSAKRTIGALSGNLELVSRRGVLDLFNLADDPTEQHNLLKEGQDAGALADDLQRFADRIEFIRADGNIEDAPPLPSVLGP